MEKKCNKCGELKSLDEFANQKNSKDGKKYNCRICQRTYDANYRKTNKEKLRQKGRRLYKNNNEVMKEKSYKFYKKNNKIILEKAKKYREDNKEKIKKSFKKWKENNKEYEKERKKTNPMFKLRCYTKSNIFNALKRQGYGKNTKTYNILKCEYDFFLKWLNGIAGNGHTYGIGNLHLDHVIPISLAKTEDEALLLCHYSNYQLLSADENLAKSNRYVNPTNLKRVLEHHPNPDKIREIHARL